MGLCVRVEPDLSHYFRGLLSTARQVQRIQHDYHKTVPEETLQANPETMTSVLFMAVGNYWKEPTSHRSSRLKFKSIHKIEVHAVF